MKKTGNKPTIYFAGSIRGGRCHAAIYAEIIRFLKAYGQVFTEHIGDDELLMNEKTMTDSEIYERDMDWLRQADVICAEVTQPSLGVGFELGMALSLSKKILCLFNSSENNRLSAMIAGEPKMNVGIYRNLDQATQLISDFFEQHDKIKSS